MTGLKTHFYLSLMIGNKVFYNDLGILQVMFISRQTHEGLQITCYSVIEATKYLLQQGFKFVLTERFLSGLT